MGRIYATHPITLKSIILFFVLSALAPLPACSQEAKVVDASQKTWDSSAHFIEFSGNILLTNIGFAPLPAFSFDSPIAIVFLSLKKGKFSYEPAFSLGLNGKPWMIDNWFRYTFIDKKIFALSAAVNPSLFFKIENENRGKETIIAQRNLCFDLSFDYPVSKNIYGEISYQYVHGFEPGALSGHILFLGGSISKLPLSTMIFIEINPQVFYFDFTGNKDGMFAAAKLNVGDQQLPLKFFLQGVQRLWSDFNCSHFKWSFGMIYHF